jgi:hypothetical protein
MILRAARSKGSLPPLPLAGRGIAYGFAALYCIVWQGGF